MKRGLVFLISTVAIIVLMVSYCISPAYALFDTWKKEYILDVFGDKTEDYYIVNNSRFSGTYNNNSVTDGALQAEILVSADAIGIKLYEKGNVVKADEFSQYSVAVKLQNGDAFVTYGTMEYGSDIIIINQNDRGTIIDTLSIQKPDSSFYLEHGTSNYLFKAKSGNFAKIYEKEINAIFKERKYQSAISLMESEQFQDALALLRELDKYKNSSQLKEKAESEIANQVEKIYLNAVSLLNEEKFHDALQIFSTIKDYKDVNEKISLCQNKLLSKYLQENDFYAALCIYGEQCDKDGAKTVLEKVCGIRGINNVISSTEIVRCVVYNNNMFEIFAETEKEYIKHKIKDNQWYTSASSDKKNSNWFWAIDSNSEVFYTFDFS